MESGIEQRAKAALEISPERRKQLLTNLHAEWAKWYFKNEPNLVGIFLTSNLTLESVALYSQSTM